MTSGIYKIENTVNGKCYVGSASYLTKRLRQHKRQLGQSKHPNSKLQRAWNKYGEHSFIFSAIELVADKGNLVAREQCWIDHVAPEYNIAKVAGSNFGLRVSDETKAKTSASMKGVSKTAEHRANMSAAAKNMTAEHKAKLSASCAGRNYWWLVGRKKTAESIAKRTATRAVNRFAAAQPGQSFAQ